MVCAETSKRRARSSTITPPEARGIFRISDWRLVSPVTAAPKGAKTPHGATVPAPGQRGRSAAKAVRGPKGESWLKRVDLPFPWAGHRERRLFENVGHLSRQVSRLGRVCSSRMMVMEKHGEAVPQERIVGNRSLREFFHDHHPRTA